MSTLFNRVFALLYLANWCYGIPFPPTTILDEIQTRATIPCNETGSDWQPHLEAFHNADTRAQLIGWNESRKSSERFDRALGRLFGDDNFVCGIDKTQCVVTGTCFEFEKSNVSAWVYQAANSAQNFNNLLDNIYTGISLAQEDATELTPVLADDVFGWIDEAIPLDGILTWIGFALSIIFAFGAPELALFVDPLVLGAFASIGDIAGSLPGLISQISLPSDLPREVGIDRLNAVFYTLSKSVRASWLTYADNIFAGLPDANGNTIVDILGHGAYVTQQNIASLTQIEKFYRSLLVAKAIDAYWREKNVYYPVYVVSTLANLDASGVDYPKHVSWYSHASGRTYIPYHVNDHAYVKEPPGLLALDGSLYGIHASQVAESVGRAYEVAPNNYTSAVAARRIQAAFTSKGVLQPFQAGAAWEGVFKIFVCDIQNHTRGIVPYYTPAVVAFPKGSLCCGADCSTINGRGINLSL